MQDTVAQCVVDVFNPVQICGGEVSDVGADRIKESAIPLSDTDLDLIWRLRLFLEIETDREVRKVSERARVGDKDAAGFEFAIRSRTGCFAAIAGGLYYWSQNFSDKISGGSGAMGYKNISYTIDGQEAEATVFCIDHTPC
jgi:hypothetical protein